MKENIELRTLGEVDPDEIGKWFQDRVGMHLTPNVLFKDLSFILSDGMKIEGKGIDLDLPIFKKKKDGEEISLRNFWMDLPKPIFYAHVPENGTHVERKIEINYILEGETIQENAIEYLENLQLITSNGIIDLKMIYIHAELWLNAKKVPLKAKLYKKTDGTIAEVVEFEFEEKGKKHTIEIISDPLSDKKSFCLVPKGHNNPEKMDITFTATKKSLNEIETKSHDYYIRLGQKNSSNHSTKALHTSGELSTGTMQADIDGQKAIATKPEDRKKSRPKKTESESKT
jgi:hypothetical protein